MKITYSTISKTGKRPNNEDAFRVIEMPEENRWMGIVCDGMGGHDFGEVASETVVSKISEFWTRNRAIPDSEETVIKACKKASVAINEKTFGLNHCQMGTTMVMASIEDNKVTIAHIGDSRCYLIRPGHYDDNNVENTDTDHVLYQTNDHVSHDYEWELVTKCFFSYHPEKAEPEIVQFEIQPGDRLLLCSDGVYKCIDSKVLKARIMGAKVPDDMLKAIESGYERYGQDNYTAIMAIINE